MERARTEAVLSVSVIVPCYNAADRVGQLVASLLEQRVAAELIFVDDGSSDATLEQLNALTSDHAHARVLIHAVNKGRAAARNTGLNAASGEVLIFLDADMVPESGFVRAHAEAHQRPEVVGVVSTPVLEGLDTDDAYHQYLLERQRRTPLRPGAPIPFRYFIIGYTSIRADVLRAVGGFDERFSYGEDIDLAYRLAQRYPDGLYVSEQAVVHHYGHGTLEERLAKLDAFGRDNLPLLLVKHCDIANAAQLGFTARSWRGRLKRWALGAVPAQAMTRAVKQIPRPLRFMALRYLMASTISEAFRDARSSVR